MFKYLTQLIITPKFKYNTSNYYYESDYLCKFNHQKVAWQYVQKLYTKFAWLNDSDYKSFYCSIHQKSPNSSVRRWQNKLCKFNNSIILCYLSLHCTWSIDWLFKVELVYSLALFRIAFALTAIYVTLSILDLSLIKTFWCSYCSRLLLLSVYVFFFVINYKSFNLQLLCLNSNLR